jgi:hypothetical protein
MLDPVSPAARQLVSADDVPSHETALLGPIVNIRRSGAFCHFV